MNYQCDNCGYTADESKFTEARDLSMRLDPGGTYTHLECPRVDCGALAYPVKPTKQPRAATQPYHFVFSIIGECCTRPHLYGITKTGRTRAEALRKAKKEVRKGDNEVYEVLQVGSLIGKIEEA